MTVLLLLFLQMTGFLAFRSHVRRAQSNLSMKATKNVLALDFDGVVCASSPESSFSSIIAAKKVWPTAMASIDMTNPTSFLSLQNEIMALRPVVETGYENMLIARYLHENKVKGAEVELQWCPSFRDQLISNYNIPKVCMYVCFILTFLHQYIHGKVFELTL